MGRPVVLPKLNIPAAMPSPDPPAPKVSQPTPKQEPPTQSPVGSVSFADEVRQRHEFTFVPLEPSDHFKVLAKCKCGFEARCMSDGEAEVAKNRHHHAKLYEAAKPR